MRYLFCMILILSNIEVQGGSYSIQPFLDYLQEKGYYEIIQAIKNSFGDDIAIAVCKELTKSNDCEEVVRVYMVFVDEDDNQGGSGMHLMPPRYIANISEIIEYFEKKCIIKTEEKRELIEYILRYYSILIQEMKDDKELIKIIQRITKIKCLIEDKKIIKEPLDKPTELIPK